MTRFVPYKFNIAYSPIWRL